MAEKPKKAAKSAAKKPASAKAAKAPPAGGRDFRHKDKQATIRPEAGAAQNFKRRQDRNPELSKAPKTYKYDSSLAPELQWCENAARGEGEAALAELQKLAQAVANNADGEAAQKIKEAAAKLQTLGAPFLDWAGKAERGNFTVPSLPLFIHERLSVEAIIKTLERHKRDRTGTLNLYGEGEASIAEKINGAYTHKNGWQNRLILGDSLLVMNSLLEYEGMGGSVQMVYMDPPYGIKFGGNFQPFVRQKNVKEDDSGLTREPEMVKAFRDTWELGVHSWLTYMRDRLLVTRDLLTTSGSCFVQISDDNVHLARNVMDEVFGSENFVSLIAFRKTSNLTAEFLPTSSDFILWYGKDRSALKFNPIFEKKSFRTMSPDNFGCMETPDGKWRRLTAEEKKFPESIPENCKLFALGDLTSSHYYESPVFNFEGKPYTSKSRYWSTSIKGLERLAQANRLAAVGDTLRYKRYVTDFAYTGINNMWHDTGTGTQTEKRLYVVQTAQKVIQRCMLMTTEPGDLVLDPTCGSGTTANVAEQWGRRWITTDVSRVPLALARQRILTSVYPFYQLKGEAPSSGFVYKRRQNKKGEEVGGIVPHVKLGDIANDDLPTEEVLVDNPEKISGEARVSGPFCVEAIMPPALKITADEEELKETSDDARRHIDRMTEFLRLTPEIRLSNNNALPLRKVRTPARALNIHAEAATTQNGEEKLAAIVFGPDNGQISERVVIDACNEAADKKYDLLIAVAFAITPEARQTLGQKNESLALPAFYAQANNDITLGNLLKQTRASQSFAVCALPNVQLKKTNKKGQNGEPLWQAKLLALDLLNPATMQNEETPAEQVPCWMLDTDYDGQCFRAGQVFFPTGAWDNISRALRAEFNETALAHLSGDTSAPFVAGEQIAVKVIDTRGNELLTVLPTQETEN